MLCSTGHVEASNSIETNVLPLETEIVCVKGPRLIDVGHRDVGRYADDVYGSLLSLMTRNRAAQPRAVSTADVPMTAADDPRQTSVQGEPDYHRSFAIIEVDVERHRSCAIAR